MITMDGQDKTKLHQLLRKWPRNTVAVPGWLNSQGISRELTSLYLKSARLTRIGHGAYIRAGEALDWTGGLYAMQTQKRLALHIGAKTALQMHGAAHYLSLGGQDPIYFWGSAKTKLPGWFKAYDWGQKIKYTAIDLFREYALGLTVKNLGNYPVTMATAERAIMEVLYFVPGKESFQEAEQLVSDLSTLRPTLVLTLLESCNSSKVKRLFVYLAEKSGHEWAEKLDFAKITFGTGKG